MLGPPRKLCLAEPKEAAEQFTTSITHQGVRRVELVMIYIAKMRDTHFCSGQSALDTIAVETSCRPKIFKMRSRQFVSSSSCPRWWNFITSVVVPHT